MTHSRKLSTVLAAALLVALGAAGMAATHGTAVLAGDINWKASDINWSVQADAASSGATANDLNW
ncbi:hypothetical protein ACFYWP_36960 [Actinacidiphila glaucinigra]|uniref:hypothetical protein n=1 Tax=Actinacidiphila glaucinigra TaxID=235986 RepID=UPI0036CBA696